MPDGDGFDLRIAAARGSGVVAVLGPGSTLVVNAGVGPDRLARLLARADRRLSDIDAVLLCNERAERVAGLPALLQRHPVRVLATEGTLRSLTERYAWAPPIEPVTHGDPALCGAFVVTAFDVPGRGQHPVGWRIEGNGLAAAIALDLAAPDERLARWLTDLDLLVLEAHYDDALLDRGTPDQQRILPGPGGRLSNEDAARLARRATFAPDARVVLVDLEPTLNDAARARRAVHAALGDAATVGAIPGHADDVRVRLDAPPIAESAEARTAEAHTAEPAATPDPLDSIPHNAPVEPDPAGEPADTDTAPRHPVPADAPTDPDPAGDSADTPTAPRTPSRARSTTDDAQLALFDD